MIVPEFYADADQVNYARRRQGEIFLRERHRMFLRRAKPGRLFDVGCGEGGFLSVARDRGFEVAGIDLDPGSIEVAKGRGLDVSTGLLFDRDGTLHPGVRRHERRFDWVTAFEVLEHQADPLHFLRLARELLSPTGVLCGSVPNRDRVLVNADRTHNTGDFPPHHFLYFSPSSLEQTLRTAGFTNVRVLPLPERDLTDLATYIEVALTGGLSRRARATRTATSTAASSSRPGKGGWRGRLKRSARVAKALPFYPAALTVRTLMPQRGRGLYFEASV